MADQGESKAIEGLDKLYEFDREPVSDDRLQPGRYFAGVYAGEHTAGTEFVIGASFVMWGAAVMDVLWGLVIGNALAVLTWTFICAPIAVQTRLTLYWYLRKIAGPAVTGIYNVVNAVLFCILGGAMITVSASAVRIPLNALTPLDIPPSTGWLPDNIWFVLTTIIVGAVVVTVAILGFKSLAKFASVCSPWMFLIFIAGGVAALPYLATQSADVDAIASWGDFLAVSHELIWTGQPAVEGEGLGFWHVVAFAWICNLAMHGGLSDMALLRYAKSHWYGLYSAFGMYLGHYLAWICAGIMGAMAAQVLQTPLIELDAGEVAWQAVGTAGVLAVVIAGWTTSNPTLYRAGLAFQAITPGWARWKVTLVVGAVTTLIACSPFVFTQLLDFVGLYGLILVPIGAIVFTEHWIFPLIGYQRYWVSRKSLAFSWPALASWALGLVAAYLLPLHLFFLFVPVSVITAVLYILFAGMAGAKETGLPPEPLETPRKTSGAEPQPASVFGGHEPLWWVAGAVALICLLVTLIVPIWVFWGGVEHFDERFAVMRTWLPPYAVVYFVTGTYWAVKRQKPEETEGEMGE